MNFKYLIVAVVLSGSLISCNGSEDKDKSTENEDVTQQDVQESLDESAEVTGEYIEGVTDDISDKVDELNKETEEQLTGLKNEFQSLNEDARREYNDQMNEIGQMSDKIRAKRIELAEAGKERQEELKKDLNKLENALEESVSKFKEEISEDK